MSTRHTIASGRAGGPGASPAASMRAFTLIELLVVVAIIGLLLSILLPSLRSAREQAKMTKCVANMRSNGQAAMVFNSEHGVMQLVTDEVGVNNADQSRSKYEYGRDNELLSWPVALSQSAGFSYGNNWDWGVRAPSYDTAKAKKDLMDPDNGMFLCPSDRVQIATPFYPRFKGSGNNGLKGTGDPDNPTAGSADMAYWGFLSYGVNEDIVGAEVAESNGRPACWRAVVNDDGTETICWGEFTFRNDSPCARFGWRLRGQLDKVYQPADVGLIFETGRDEENSAVTGYANLVISAGSDKKVAGPYLANFQQQQVTRMPNSRHPKQAINVLFADGHGEKTTPVEFEEKDGPRKGLPLRYAPQVRVSPYPPGLK